MARTAPTPNGRTEPNQTTWRAVCTECRAVSPEYDTQEETRDWRLQHNHEDADCYHGHTPQIMGVLPDW